MQAQPDYTLYDQKGREAFLSQTGTFAPSERETFHRLCKIWNTNLSWQSALSILSADSPTARTDLSSVMQKLQKAQCGIVRTIIQDGVRSPQTICLTNPGDLHFFCYLTEELLWDVVEDMTKPLPSLDHFKERNLELSAGMATECDYPSLAKITAEPPREDEQLLVVQGPPGTVFAMTRGSIKRFLTVAIAKFQGYFQNANFLAVIAQMKNISIMDLRKQLTQKDPLFWHELATFISASQKELSGLRKTPLDMQIFSVAWFIKNFLAEQMSEQRKRREMEIERATDMKTVVEKIRSAVNLVVTEQDLAETLLYYKPKYNDDFQAFKDEFQKLYLDTPQGKNLPVIVRVSNVYIHMDNIHPYFLQNVNRLGKDLLSYYIRHMETYIKHPNNPGYEAFYTVENFDNHILDQVRSMSLPMFELLDRPNLVAEAMIHSVKKQNDIKNPLEIRQVLAGFFHTDRIRFLSPSVVLGLAISDIYKVAFLRTSILRQLILKITGRHDSFTRKFAGFMPDFGSYDEGDSIRTKKVRDSGDDGEDQASTTRRNRQERQRRQESVTYKPKVTKAGTSGLALPTDKPKQPKVYSDHERNEAWESFSKTIKK